MAPLQLLLTAQIQPGKSLDLDLAKASVSLDLASAQRVSHPFALEEGKMRKQK